MKKRPEARQRVMLHGFGWSLLNWNKTILILWVNRDGYESNVNSP